MPAFYYYQNILEFMSCSFTKKRKNDIIWKRFSISFERFIKCRI